MELSNIELGVNSIFKPDDTVQVLFLGVNGRKSHTHVGWFPARDVAKYAGQVRAVGAFASGVYLLPGNLPASFLGRCKPGQFPKVRSAGLERVPAPATNQDVTGRPYLLVDVDPERPAGTSATDDEKAVAVQVADAVADFLTRAGWSRPLRIDSGNGQHLYFKLPAALPGGEVDSATDPIARLLAALGNRFDTQGAKVDRTVFNAARVMRLPGTWARKGENTPSRPHRASRVVEVPSDWGSAAGGDSVELIDATIAALGGDLPAATPTPAAAPSAVHVPDCDDESTIRRARGYLSAMPAAVQGSNGSGATYAAACALVHGFALSPEASLRLLIEDYNPRCAPCWSESELAHKVRDASNKSHNRERGYLLATGGPSASASVPSVVIVPRPTAAPLANQPTAATTTVPTVLEHDDDPWRLARIIEANYRDGDESTLIWWHDDWWLWSRASARWVLQKEVDFKADLTNQVRAALAVIHAESQRAFAEGRIDKLSPCPRVTVSLVSSVLTCLRPMVHLPSCVAQPSWIRGHAGPPIDRLCCTTGGILDMAEYAEKRERTEVIPVTPKLFAGVAATWRIDFGGGPPADWLKFLSTVWPDDPESIALLQEWMGYLLSSDTKQEKMLLMLGPPRCGKGTISRVIRQLVGDGNCCGPSLASLSSSFGLATLVGKSVALIEDARLPSRSDTNVLAGNLLTISGRGITSIDRKFKDANDALLCTRFVICSNEIPAIPDRGRALANRWSILRFRESFLGREDLTLEGRLQAELSAIALWAIEGWARLQRQGRFAVPEGSREAIEQAESISAPVTMFLSERCEMGPQRRVTRSDLFAEWVHWCGQTGRRETGSREEFGRQLKAACHEVNIKRWRDNGVLVWGYEGVGLAQVDGNGNRIDTAVEGLFDTETVKVEAPQEATVYVPF